MVAGRSCYSRKRRSVKQLNKIGDMERETKQSNHVSGPLARKKSYNKIKSKMNLDMTKSGIENFDNSSLEEFMDLFHNFTDDNELRSRQPRALDINLVKDFCSSKLYFNNPFASC